MVRTVLLSALRMRDGSLGGASESCPPSPPAVAMGDIDMGAARWALLLPRLPAELWLGVLRYCNRKDFAVPARLYAA